MKPGSPQVILAAGLAIVYSSEPAALWSNNAIKTQFLGVPRSER